MRVTVLHPTDGCFTALFANGEHKRTVLHNAPQAPTLLFTDLKQDRGLAPSTGSAQRRATKLRIPASSVSQILHVT